MHTTTDPQLIGLLIIAALAVLIYFLHQSTDCESEAQDLHGPHTKKDDDPYLKVIRYRQSMGRA